MCRSSPEINIHWLRFSSSSNRKALSDNANLYAKQTLNCFTTCNFNSVFLCLLFRDFKWQIIKRWRYQKRMSIKNDFLWSLYNFQFSQKSIKDRRCVVLLYLHMRWIFKEIFIAIRLNVFLGVNRKLFVRIQRDQHLTDVGLERKHMRIDFHFGT